MANKAMVYRLYPNDIQDAQCQKTFGCCRFVYNQMLTIQQDRYQNKEKYLSKTDANNYCNRVLKTDYPFLKEIDKFALTNAIYHLAEGYQRFFKRQGGFPKYKNKHRAKKSYTTNYTNGNNEVGDTYVKLPKLGKVKAKIHRKPKEAWLIKSATITKNRDDSYQVAILYEYEETIHSQNPTLDNTLGLDYKSDGLYADSNGTVCGMPHYYRNSACKLAKAQQKLKHKIIGSNNYHRHQKRIARIHRHTANQRKDFLHKQSTAIAKQYVFVCVENLNMKALSNKGFGNGKATLDNGYGMFLNMLEYKLHDRGGKLVKVDKFYSSSQLCHNCGAIHPEMKDLSIRTIKCGCGYVSNRDENAARNIKKEGFRLLTA